MSAHSDSISRAEFLKRASITTAGAAFGVPTVTARTKTSATIEYRTLGRTGLSVSAIGFGTVRVDQPNVVRRVLNSGVNFIDTGRTYANGKNEEMFGKVMKGMRKDVVVQTKFTSRIVGDAGAIMRSIEASLKALDTDYIDIMMIHSVSTISQLRSPAVRETLEKARAQGKIRFTGFSSHGANSWKLLKEASDSGLYDAALVAYNHAGQFDHTVYEGFHVDWNQDALEREISAAVENGMAVEAMKTCSGGPYRETPDSQATFPAGLKWILGNRNISTTTTHMASFREIEENLAVMEG